MTTMKELAERVHKCEVELAHLSGRMAEMRRPVSLFPPGAKLNGKKTAAYTTLVTAIAAAIFALAKYFG